MSGQYPAEWKANNTSALTDSGGSQGISDFATYQLCIIGHRVERERRGKGLFHLHSAVGAAQNHAIEAAAINGQSQNRRTALLLQPIKVKASIHSRFFSQSQS